MPYIKDFPGPNLQRAIDKANLPSFKNAVIEIAKALKRGESKCSFSMNNLESKERFKVENLLHGQGFNIKKVANGDSIEISW